MERKKLLNKIKQIENTKVKIERGSKELKTSADIELALIKKRLDKIEKQLKIKKPL